MSLFRIWQQVPVVAIHSAIIRRYFATRTKTIRRFTVCLLSIPWRSAVIMEQCDSAIFRPRRFHSRLMSGVYDRFLTFGLVCIPLRREQKKAPQVGLEPTALRLTVA